MLCAGFQIHILKENVSHNGLLLNFEYREKLAYPAIYVTCHF